MAFSAMLRMFVSNALLIADCVVCRVLSSLFEWPARFFSIDSIRAASCLLILPAFVSSVLARSASLPTVSSTWVVRVLPNPDRRSPMVSPIFSVLTVRTLSSRSVRKERSVTSFVPRSVRLVSMLVRRSSRDFCRAEPAVVIFDWNSFARFIIASFNWAVISEP